MYTLKSIARRGTLFGAVGALLVAAVVPASPAFADALNPLTERSLMLSSSAPGFVDTDGSGNSAAGGSAAPNAIGQNYAPAGSGPNGKKTGESFSFKMSTNNATIKAYTLQYCTTAAGRCQAPGNNAGSTATSNRQDNEDSAPGAADGGWSDNKSDLNILNTFTQDTTATTPANVAAGKFQVFVNGAASAGTDWTFNAANVEDSFTPTVGGLTGKNNMITITSATGDTIPTGQKVEIVFKASETTYITNPGAGAFFVKINSYDTDTSSLLIPTVAAANNNNIVDGGVTVANVMTDSIHITTKVLETMAFSVGTRNRDTVTLNCAGGANVATGCEGVSGYVHGTCDAVQNVNNNRLNLGNPDAENSLETGQAWSVYSYWRLSSNSSGGATVYYSGNTLANTVGDSIRDMKTEAASTPGTEQFGLGFVAPEAGSAEYIADQPGRAIDSFPFRTLNTGQSTVSTKWDPATLPAQLYTAQYDEAQGSNIGGTDSASHVSSDAKFKFNEDSLTVPEPIAQQNEQVISCATAKMRYVGNIAADTPAGVYTTKINYLAAPQY